MIKLSLVNRLGLALGCAALVLPSNPMSAEGNRQPAGGLEMSQTDAKPKSDASEGRSLIIQGEFATTIQVLPPFPSFPPGPFQPLLHLLITADGNLSHFGKTTAATTDEVVDLSVNPNQGTGHWVFQNTKGDALWTELDLIATLPDVKGRTEFSGTLTVIGGAGKFAGATGSLLGVGFAQGNSGSFSVVGTIHVTSDDD